jgi:DNA polymerase-3 subunit gamma/tau
VKDMDEIIEKPFHIKHRPKDFSEIIGNEEAVRSLERLVEEKSVTTYMLWGERGCGKTTLARIMANNLGVLSSNDIKEYDIADVGLKNKAREIKRQANTNTWSGGAMVFILDECQESSKSFQQALLKTLEDPRRNKYFIICTTNPEKILGTIRSRCVAGSFNVELLNSNNSKKLIKRICEKEGISVKKSETRAIIKKSEGCPREIVSLLQKIQGIEDSEARIKVINGVYQNEEEKIIELCQMLINKENWKNIASFLRKLKEDPEKVRYAILRYLNVTLLNSGNLKVASMIDLFENSFIYSKKAGLTKACRWALEV